ncbi:MAG TPA: thioredoxin domain-containing protein [candidate division Zixibacteria bacterium]|nr:thioredoxin domain-containing protein [candidate division Zixibacteria bacterium]
MKIKTDKNADTVHHNRLINEKSPYLLQHAANPVDWYPWGTEAFEKAHKEDKPVFLSIGYSTCHWCHVMENESFQDQAIGDLINDAFVAIKVDREERPDIDNIYMAVCQMLTGSGGWPLTIIMTPDKKPFYAGTYIPRESRFGLIGLTELVPRIKEIWNTRRDDIIRTADQITEALKHPASPSGDSELGEPILKSAFEEFEMSYDRRFGGFGSAPKFPAPHNFLFLLRYWKRANEDLALEMVERTLTAMRQGGIYDHLGFGIHRYSTDTQWLVPHFEKMLYDQALMAIANIEAFQATGNENYRKTAVEIFTYVMRDMTDLGGGFYSAEDADSDGVEGKFYVWSAAEIRAALEPDEADLAIKIFNIENDGNFDDPTGNRKTGQNILHTTKPIPDIAKELGFSPDEMNRKLEKIRTRLFEIREARIHPRKDDKILIDWNGLMIAALALGGQVFNDQQYIEAARNATNFIMGNMRSPDGRLIHRYRENKAAMQASIDDYAFLIWGLLNLYEASFDIRYLRDALELNGDMLDHFWDKSEGGFFFTADDSEKLPVRKKELLDGAVPSGSSVAALNLLRMGRLTGIINYDGDAEKTIHQTSGQIRLAPRAFTMLLCALDFVLGPAYEIVIVGRPNADDTQRMLMVVRTRFIPNKILVVKPASHDSPEVVHFADFIKAQSSIGGKATAYICHNYACVMPTTDVLKLAELLEVKNASSGQ